MTEDFKKKLEKFKAIYGPALLISVLWMVIVVVFSDCYLVEAYLNNKIDYVRAYCNHMLSLATLLTQISCMSLAILDYCSSASEKKKWFIFSFLVIEGTLIFCNYRIVSLRHSQVIDNYRWISINTAYIVHGAFLFFLWLCKYLTEMHNKEEQLLANSYRANGITRNR